MKRNFWLIYIVLYLAFIVWVYLQLPESYTFNITGTIEMGMLIGILGLGLGKRIINLTLWRIFFWFGVLLFIHAWFVMPPIYISNGFSWKTIGIIQLFAIPSIPIYIGLYIYAWRSPEIWSGNAQQGAQAGP